MESDDHIFWRDEVLQILVWMRGEGLNDSPSAAELSRFLGIDEEPLRRHLQQMVLDGYLASIADRFSVTKLGRSEGGRRFREEFESLQGHGHGECSDPDCDCHQYGPEHCKSHAHQTE